MATRRRMRFVYAQTGVMLASVVVLVALGAFSLEAFFVCSLVGLLVVTELTAPVTLQPRWRRRLVLVLVACLVAFGYVISRAV